MIIKSSSWSDNEKPGPSVSFNFNETHSEDGDVFPVDQQMGMEMVSEEENTGSEMENPTETADIFDRQILDLVNQERAKVGADPLSINEQLDRAADLHSQDQASMNNMSHTGSNGSDMMNRIQGENYQYSMAAENVAVGYEDPVAAMAGWMGSEDHRDNILNPDLQEIGMGFANGDDGSFYWTQDFGTEIA